MHPKKQPNGVVAELDELIALKTLAGLPKIRRLAKASSNGQHHANFRGRGMDFAEARAYQAGDDIRHMDWNITARTGRAHVKIYQEERERPVILLVDFSRSMYFGTRVAFKSVIAARLAALIAWTTILQGDRVGSLLHSPYGHEEFKPRSRVQGALAILAALSEHTKEINSSEPKLSGAFKNHLCFQNATPQADHFNQALIRLRHVAKPGCLLIILSDFYQLNKESKNNLQRLKLHHDLIAYPIFDPLELAPPVLPGIYPFTGKEEKLQVAHTEAAPKEAILEVTSKPNSSSSQNTYELYENYCEERVNYLKQSFHELQIQHAFVRTDTKLPDLLRQSFPRRMHG